MNIKYIITSVFLFVSASLLIAQDTKIKGLIISGEDSAPLSGVYISYGANKGTYTNDKGEFQFTQLAIGKYPIAISSLGFAKIDTVITIDNVSQIIDLGTLTIQPSAISIQEIVIVQPSISLGYSTRYQGSNTIVTQKEILQTAPIGTEEVLKKVAGVNISGDMGISNRLNAGIRGSYPRRAVSLLLLEDGTPIAPAPYLAPEAYYNPPSDRLDGIEIIKGADILAYGANTVYGVINYITKRPPSKPTLGVNLTGGGNGYNSQYLTYGGTWDKIGAEIQILNKSFGGFQDNSSSSIFNTTAKMFAEFGKKSSIYVKLNYHQEKSKATYSALTPFSFNLDPTQNPFDADDLNTKRYAVDIIHKYQFGKNLVLSSKVYAHQFNRDWWRQENTLIKASTARTYLGDEIYFDRYSYLEGKTFGTDDYVRVGKVVNGKESTRARNRQFRVAGVQETINYKWTTAKTENMLEIGIKGHSESFKNQEFKNDSSRFSRSGTMDKDEQYDLYALSSHIKHSTTFNNKFSITPLIRFELVDMRKYNMIQIAQSADNDGSRFYGSKHNTFTSLLPGINLGYLFFNRLNFYAGVYKGYTAPIADVGFLNVNNEGVVGTPATDADINMQPETSLNYEAGIRGYTKNNFINGQATYFNNNISNFYSAGRNEAFESLGKVNINGVELATNFNLHELYKNQKHKITIGLSASLMRGRVLSGRLKDSDLLKAKHTNATKQELVDKINSEREGYDVYFASSGGQDSLVTRELNSADFSSIKRLDLNFGDGLISKNSIPYLPQSILNASINYIVKAFTIGANYNYVGTQYTDYLNFNNETAEGAIGKLNAFSTIDINASYSFENSKKKYLKGLTIFATGKNITNEIYAASRLHRVSSGIMPGGFRQINGGIRFIF